MKYNGQNIITTDDITVSGDSLNIGKDLTTILDEQSVKLSKLTSNVKWLAKYGGVGGSGTSGTTVTSLKFTIYITYTDISGEKTTTTWKQTNTSGNYLLVKPNTLVSMLITINSVMSSTVSYTAVLTYGTTAYPGTTFDVTTGTASFTFYPLEALTSCSLLIRGDSIITIPFTCYTELISENVVIESGRYTISNNLSVYPSQKDNLTLVSNIKALVPSLFDVEMTSLTINGESISSELSLVHNYSIGDYFANYGIYIIKLNYQLYNVSSKVVLDTYEITINLIYKDPDSIYIHCYTLIDGAEISESNLITATKTYNGRNLPIYYRVYGTLYDNLLTTYYLTINGVLQSLATTVQTDVLYTIKNSVTETTWFPITFSVTSVNYSKTYYTYLSTPDLITYIYKNNDVLCYGALGATTDDTTTLSVVTFPSTSYYNNLGVYQFTKNTTMLITTSPTYALAGSNLTTISKFIKASTTTASAAYDLIINIGINYLDKSYTKSIFSITDSTGGNTITFYRNKILIGIEDPIEKWSIPNDGDYHLVTIYFKLLYYTNVPNTWNTGLLNGYFTVYIDGIQELIPTSTSGFSIGKNTKVTFSSGQTTYNLLSMHFINPIDMTYDTDYNNLIKKYVLDFDPILVSNFAMVYKNEHYDENTNDTTTYSEGMFFDSSIYDTLCWGNSSEGILNWINYYLTSSTKELLNKFLPIKASTIAKLLNSTNGETNIPMYKIIPNYSEGLVDLETGMHSFLYNTYTSYDEEDEEAKILYDCKIQKYYGGQWVDLFDSSYPYYSGEEKVEDIPIKFLVRYLGSSTLLYSAKNFEIKAETATTAHLSTIAGNENISYKFYFNPNSDMWDYPEEGFNLKADLVDSSSCTNNIVGNFVNDYMISPFNTGGKTYLSCLSGYPILLFMEDNNTSTSSENDILLGIYNCNLNRSSVNNLGYQTLPDLSTNTYTSNIDSKATISIKRSDEICTYNTLFTVAEISGNSGVYDFTLTNRQLLSKMYGDWFALTSDNAISEDYSDKVRIFANDFSRYCYNNIIKNSGSNIFNLWNYNYSTLIDRKEEVLTKNPSIHYYNGETKVTITSSSTGKIVEAKDINKDNYPYRYLVNGISYVGNPLYLFCIVLDDNDNEIISNGDYYYYILLNTDYGYSSTTNVNNFNLLESIKYYIICMAFAMVDSVQKNLTIKNVGGTDWYPEFYDMDTGLGLDNAGGNSDFKAFSDYVTSAGLIILDYVETGQSGWFDTPSSLLFLYAKYDYLLNHSLDGYSHGTSLNNNTPYQHWATLRGLSTSYSSLPYYNKLKSATLFCNEYLYPYLNNKISPLVWNLNYMYKYFSATKSGTISATDNESKRFNGSMKYRRLDWLDNRLHYLDALFGIANTRNIGKSNVSISDVISSSNNSDITICNLMFPAFDKGVTGVFYATIYDDPRTPVVFKLATGVYKLYLTDDTGKAIISLNITTNDSVGFLGTLNLTSISECGLFLSSSETTNSMQGNRLTSISINNTKLKSTNILLVNLPSVSEVLIGSLSTSLTSMSASLVINGKLSNSNTLLDIFKIQGANFASNTVTLSNIEFDAFTLASVKAGTITFNYCTFNEQLNLNSNINIPNIIFTGCTFKNGILVNQSSSSCSVTLDNCTALSDSSYLSIRISTSALKTLNLSKVTCSELIVDYPKVLTHNDDSSLTLSNISTNLLVFNSLAKSSGSTTYANDIITSISIDKILPASGTVVLLSLGGFRTLTELTITKTSSCTIELIDGGVAYSQLTSLPDSIDRMGESAAYAFLDCLNLNYSNLISRSNFFTIVLNLKYAFALSSILSSTLTLSNIKDILNELIDTNSLNLQYTFLGRVFGSITTLVSVLNCIDIANAYPDNVLGENSKGTFYGSGVSIFVKEFVSKLKGVYSGFIGACGTISSFESESLKDFTSVLFTKLYTTTDIGLLANGYGSVFITIDRINSNKVTVVTDVKYTTEFTNVLTIEGNIYTTFNTLTYLGINYGPITFDFGSTGVGNNLKYYKGLFKYDLSECNVLNLANAFKYNYDNITIQSIDLSQTTFPSAYTYFSNPESYTDLYDFLVDDNMALRTKLLALSNLVETTGTSNTFFTFHKYITYKHFNILIELLANRSSKPEYLNAIFSNCVVLGESDDEKTDYSDLLYHKLYPFKYLVKSFYNFVVYDSNRKELYLSLDKAFETVIDGNTVLGNVLNLYEAFAYNKLIPFSLVNSAITLGISNNSVLDMIRTFAYCDFLYNSYPESLGILTFDASYFIQVSLPSDNYNFPLLPEEFFNILNTSAVIQETFAQNTDNSKLGYRMRGYIPTELSYWSNTNLPLASTFLDCIVFWVKENDDYRIFPTWYANNSGTNKFKVMMLFPLTTAVPYGSIKCYLFYKTGDVDLSISSYLTKLPYLPPTSTSSAYVYDKLGMSYGESSANRVRYVYGSNQSDSCLPTSNSLDYSEIIESPLLFMLKVGEDVITELSTVSGNFYINTSIAHPNDFDPSIYFFLKMGVPDAIKTHLVY